MEKGSKAFGMQKQQSLWDAAEPNRNFRCRELRYPGSGISLISLWAPFRVWNDRESVPSSGGSEVAAQECREQQSSPCTEELLVLAMDVFVDSL